MGRIYDVPPATNEKEKVVGGLLTAGQAAYLGIGAGLCVAVIFLFIKLSGNLVLSVICGLPFLLVGVPFAFKKKCGLPLPLYLKYKKAFKAKNKKLLNKRLN